MTTGERPATKVLFIDDHTGTRHGYASFLTGQGFEVCPAQTGEQGLRLARDYHPDVIVLDLGLPDIDGWEVARQLKARPETAAVPIVALTGANLPHERVSAMRAGCDRYLSKPCDPADLLEAIRRSTEG